MSLSFHLLSSRAQVLIPALVGEVNGVYIIRTLDPELPHQITLSRVFKSAGLSTCYGLCHYGLERGIDYFTDLGSAGPKLYEIWTTVHKTRNLIQEVWRSPPSVLVELTSPALDGCWSLYDVTRSSMLHNWSLKSVRPEDYSTGALLDAVFDLDDVQCHEKSDWLRTGLPQFVETEQDEYDAALIHWSVKAVERYHDREEDDLSWLEVVNMSNRGKIEASTETFEMVMVETFEKTIHKQTKSTGTQTDTQVKQEVSVERRSIAVQTSPVNYNRYALFILLLFLIQIW